MKAKAAKRICFCPIVFIARKGIALTCKMGADLIFSAGIKAEFKKGVAFSPGNNLVVSAGCNRFKFCLTAAHSEVSFVNTLLSAAFVIVIFYGLLSQL